MMTLSFALRLKKKKKRDAKILNAQQHVGTVKGNHLLMTSIGCCLHIFNALPIVQCRNHGFKTRSPHFSKKNKLEQEKKYNRVSLQTEEKAACNKVAGGYFSQEPSLTLVLAP